MDTRTEGKTICLPPLQEWDGCGECVCVCVCVGGGGAGCIRMSMSVVVTGALMIKTKPDCIMNDDNNS